MRTFVSSEGILGGRVVEEERCRPGVADDFSCCRSAVADLVFAYELHPKMPLTAASSGVYIQNTAPGFISTPG